MQSHKFRRVLAERVVSCEACRSQVRFALLWLVEFSSGVNEMCVDCDWSFGFGIKNGGYKRSKTYRPFDEDHNRLNFPNQPCKVPRASRTVMPDREIDAL